MRIFVSVLIAATAIAGLTACGSQPSEAELRAADQKAMAQFEKEHPNDLASATSPEGDNVSPAELKLIDDYNKNPNATIDALCDKVTKDGC